MGIRISKTRTRPLQIKVGKIGKSKISDTYRFAHSWRLPKGVRMRKNVGEKSKEEKLKGRDA